MRENDILLDDIDIETIKSQYNWTIVIGNKLNQHSLK